MTLKRENLRLIGYLIELSLFMLMIHTIVKWSESIIYMWELGLGLMGAGIVLLAVFKVEKYDKLFISIFQFGLSLLLSDLDNFVFILLGGGLI